MVQNLESGGRMTSGQRKKKNEEKQTKASMWKGSAKGQRTRKELIL